MIALCGLSSWDTPTPVQCIVLCSVFVDWPSSTVCVCNGFICPAQALFLAISPLIKLLAKLLVQSNR